MGGETEASQPKRREIVTRINRVPAEEDRRAWKKGVPERQDGLQEGVKEAVDTQFSAKI